MSAGVRRHPPLNASPTPWAGGSGTERDLDPGLEAYAESLYPERFGWSRLYALRQGRYKFIEAPRPELYDLERDPFELRNIHAEHTAIAGTLRRRLAELATDRTSGPAARGPISHDLQQRLASLGYVGGSAARVGELPDPKDCISASAGTNHVAGC